MMESNRAHRQRQTVNPIAGTAAVILQLLSEMPLACVTELASRGELNGVSRASVHAHLNWFCQRDYAGHAIRGWHHRKTRRYFLHSKGAASAIAGDAQPPEWSNGKTALRRLLRQGPLVELAYHVAPHLFDSNAVVEAWRRAFPLSRFRWLSRGPVSAVAEYEPDHFVGDSNAKLVVAYIWYGIRPKRNPFHDDSARLMNSVKTESADDLGSPPRPCGVVILAADRLAGLRARRDLPSGVPRAIVTFKDRFGDSLIESMEPESRTDRVLGVERPTNQHGRPEHVHTFLAQDPVVSNVMGRTDYLVLKALEGWPGCSIRQLARLCGHPKSAISDIVAGFLQSGLLEWDAGLLYPTALIEAFAEERDRLARRKYRGRAGAERSPTGKRRTHMRRHEAGVIELAIRFREAGIFVAAGWRFGMYIAGRTQVTPDLWALVPLGDGRAMWHAVEYERSAVGEKRILKKMRPHQVAWQLGQAVPLLMICETAAAARRFQELGRGIPMLAAVYRDALNSPFQGEASPWHHDGTPVAIDHLQDVPMWSSDHHDRMLYLLVEQMHRDL